MQTAAPYPTTAQHTAPQQPQRQFAPTPQAGGSIFSRLQRVAEKPKEAAQQQQTAAQTTSAPAANIDPTALTAAWNEFAYNLPAADNYLKTIMSTMPRCQGNIVTVDIITPSQSAICENAELISFLRNRLGNNTITIRTNLVERQEETSATPFTSKQKLDVLVAENPNLHKLIEKFGLSFDY